MPDRLDSVISAYLEAAERGEPSDPGYWIERYPDLATELEAFFNSETQFDRLVAPFRTRTPFVAPRPTVPNIAGAAPLRTIGGYEILSELGRGGMGVIYKARQLALNRLVAVKMIRSAEWATPDERMRFRVEAETVAALDHPNIVPIYEVGEVVSDETRLPFFSMKLIEGENLAQARERFRRDWPSVARLVGLVARAVGHAHHRGVLHRDLKPANVLLGVAPAGGTNEELGRGSGFALGGSVVTPHISDFGLARRGHQRGATLPGAILGTPAYLAPELTRGTELATSASDVYSLGAILYELLTGGPPFQGATPFETMRLIVGGAVKAPRAADPAVPPDLETICMKCLAPDPDKRYPSADELAEDLDHFLAHRPITARPIGPVRRLGRWARRQPVIAGLSAALAAVVLVSLPLVVWNWRRAVAQEAVAETRLGEAQRERDRAVAQEQLAESRLGEVRRERDRADDAFGLAQGALVDVFRLLAEDRWDEMPGTERAKRQLLENGLKYFRSFVDRHQDDPKLRSEVANALFQSGMIASRIGPLRDAVESYRRAGVILRALAAAHPDEAVHRELLARALNNLGNALAALNRLDEALAVQDEAAAVWRQLRAASADGAEATREQARALLNRAVALQSTEDWARVLEALHRGQSVLTEGGRTAGEPKLMIQFLVSASQAEDHLGRPAEALRDAREAVRLAEQMTKAAPASEDARLMRAHAARSVGNLYRKQGDLEAARTDLRLAQQLLAALHEKRPRVTEYSWNLSGVGEELAALAEAAQRPAEALSELERAEGLLKELVERDSESHPNRSSLARVERRLGRLHQARGDAEATRKAFEQAKTQLEYLLALDSPRAHVRSDLAGVCHQLGVAYAKLQKYPEAAAVAVEAAKHYRVLMERAPTDVRVRKNLSSVLGNLAIAQRARQRLSEALGATEDRVRLWPDNPQELFDAATDFTRSFDSAARSKERDTQTCDRALKAAISTLRQAIRAGLNDPEKIRTDARFAPLRETAEFQTFLREVATRP